MYFDISWKHDRMLHWGLRFRLGDWFTLHQKETWARQNFDVGIFSLKPNGLCPLVETLVLQDYTERMQDFLVFPDLSKPNATLKLVLLCAEEWPTICWGPFQPQLFHSMILLCISFKTAAYTCVRSWWISLQGCCSMLLVELQHCRDHSSSNVSIANSSDFILASED